MTHAAPHRPPGPSRLGALLLALLLCPTASLALGSRDSAALAQMKQFAGSRSGLLVWQSRRSGPLRLFACDLDGSNLRQLSPDVSGKDHIAPMISPDGQRVLYYQTATLSDSTYYGDHVGQMMLVQASDTKGSSAKQLVAEVRTFFECRFARWIDNDTIAYIGKDHDGYLYSISKGSSTKLFDYPLGTFGAIPNRQLTHAIDGKNRVFQLSGSSASQKQDFDGCEGNMSADGQYAYRVKGGSHDFTRMKLSDWSEQGFFNNHDSALPSGQNYIYFPQLSPCQRYLAFSASPGQHDHFNSDYDIFVVPVDPKSFTKTGPAVKYSFHGALDSYPDIWVAPEKPGLASIVLSTTNQVLQPGDQVQLTALLTDQNGDPFAATLSWSVDSGGSISPAQSSGPASSASALFQSDGSAGTHTVSASAAGVSGSLELQVVDLSFPIQINCGSNEHDQSGWQRDDLFVTGGEDWTNPNEVDTTGVSGAAPPAVYRSVRHNSPHSYSLPVPNGSYRLRLHFADAFADPRAMTYQVEGQVLLKDFDIVTHAGGVNRAWVEQHEVTVSDGNGLQIVATSEGDVFEAGLELEAIDLQPPQLPDSGLQPAADGGPLVGSDAGPGSADAASPARASGLGGGCQLGRGGASPALALLLLLGLWGQRRRQLR